MYGERNLIKHGYRYDIIVDFPTNRGNVRVAVRKTKRTAERFAELFRKRNKLPRGSTWLRLRHDPLLDEVMNKCRGS
jgi:hypothetical protein